MIGTKSVESSIKLHVNSRLVNQVRQPLSSDIDNIA